MSRGWINASLLAATAAVASGEEVRPLVIAHRGASGYLPEHTLEAVAAAHAMGADYIEQDIVLTKDNQPIVLHDIQLDTVTNVAQVFPDRSRNDGRYYAADLTLNEIRRLRVHERTDPDSKAVVFKQRFPVGASRLEIATLEEQIELIRGLNKTTGREVGLYVEIKKPAWHRQQGRDVSRIVLETLARHGYRKRSDACYVQCFDDEELRRLREQLRTDLKLVQLIGKRTWNDAPAGYDRLLTEEGLRDLARHADGIGPWTDLVIEGRDEASGQLTVSPLVSWAKQHGLEVHVFTFRADELPDFADDFPGLVRTFAGLGVDGLFTDFPDQARLALISK